MKLQLSLIALALISVSCSSADKNVKAENPAVKEEKVTPEVKAENKVSCNLAKSQRIIEVVKTDKGCELFYTRDGEKFSKASSDQGVTHCQKVAKNIQSNLTNAGFSCN